MKNSILVIAFLICCKLTAQEKPLAFEGHQNLIGGTWKSEAKWKDGTPHNLHVVYEKGLSGKLIKTKTFGNVSKDGFEFGLRNEGVRRINPETNAIEFYEFDVFGGLTKGKVTYVGSSIFYTYLYGSGDTAMSISDGWEFVNQNTYKYTIGVYDFETKAWKQTFLEAEMKREK